MLELGARPSRAYHDRALVKETLFNDYKEAYKYYLLGRWAAEQSQQASLQVSRPAEHTLGLCQAGSGCRSIAFGGLLLAHHTQTHNCKRHEAVRQFELGAPLRRRIAATVQQPACCWAGRGPPAERSR